MSRLYNHMDYSPPGSSVHGILQARILEWIAMPSSRGSSQPRDWTRSPKKASEKKKKESVNNLWNVCQVYPLWPITVSGTWLTSKTSQSDANSGAINTNKAYYENTEWSKLNVDREEGDTEGSRADPAPQQPNLPKMLGRGTKAVYRWYLWYFHPNTRIVGIPKYIRHDRSSATFANVL